MRRLNNARLDKVHVGERSCREAFSKHIGDDVFITLCVERETHLGSADGDYTTSDPLKPA